MVAQGQETEKDEGNPDETVDDVLTPVDDVAIRPIGFVLQLGVQLRKFVHDNLPHYLRDLAFSFVYLSARIYHSTYRWTYSLGVAV